MGYPEANYAMLRGRSQALSVAAFSFSCYALSIVPDQKIPAILLFTAADLEYLF